MIFERIVESLGKLENEIWDSTSLKRYTENTE